MLNNASLCCVVQFPGVTDYSLLPAIYCSLLSSCDYYYHLDLDVLALKNIENSKASQIISPINHQFGWMLIPCKESFIIRITMLICPLRAQIKKLKIKLKHKFCFVKIRFYISKIWNTQFSKKYLYI